MHRTSVMLPDDVYEALRRLAAAQQKPLSEVIRDAAQSFLADRKQKARVLSFAAMGNSGTGDVSIRAEEYLSSSLKADHEKRDESRR